MEVVIVIALILTIAILILKLKINSNENEKYEYSKKESLMSEAEKKFFHSLKIAINDNAEVFSKVRIADILEPRRQKNRKTWWKTFNRISSKHFDFVICKKDSLDVICAIELDDKSHLKSKAMKRDKLVEEACISADFALVRVKAKGQYEITAIREKLAKYVNQ